MPEIPDSAIPSGITSSSVIIPEWRLAAVRLNAGRSTLFEGRSVLRACSTACNWSLRGGRRGLQGHVAYDAMSLVRWCLRRIFPSWASSSADRTAGRELVHAAAPNPGGQGLTWHPDREPRGPARQYLSPISA